jgi:glucose-6-phosphate isomerase
MQFDDGFLEQMAPAMKRAFEAMDALEGGAIANPDEKRMVGHYWLRAPQLAPKPEIAAEIKKTIADIKQFAADVHSGAIQPPTAPRFTRVLVIGIGGSALGPMFVADALGNPATDRMRVDFVDNTDPDGIARMLQSLARQLGETLCIVTSKSGGTPETRNGMLLLGEAYKAAGLEFTRHAVAITMPVRKWTKRQRTGSGSRAFRCSTGSVADEQLGGRFTPGGIAGWIDRLLAGAAACDEATRQHEVKRNPAAMLALMWHHATGGKGQKDMVVLPYKDRLLLFSRYLQQLVMESIGKRLDLQGKRVDQGLTVYGNKGSTDQHAYVQQLR